MGGLIAVREIKMVPVSCHVVIPKQASGRWEVVLVLDCVSNRMRSVRVRDCRGVGWGWYGLHILLIVATLGSNKGIVLSFLYKIDGCTIHILCHRLLDPS